MGRRRWVAMGAAIVAAAAVAPAPLVRADAGADSTWVVTAAPGAKVDVDGRRIGPRDVVIEATASEAAALAVRPDVIAVEPDRPAAAADLPLDPCLLGPGCPVPADQRALRRIGAEAAWAVVRSAPDVVVGIIDAGVDTTHPDLAGRVTAVPPGAGGCAALPVSLGTTDRTTSGHGTRVAGLVAAAGDGQGIAGVAFGGIRVRAYTALGPDLRGSTADVAAALHCAVDDGVDVVNLSLTAGDTTAMRNALDRAEMAGVVVVAAAGNGGDGNHAGAYPAAHPSVIAVTAVAAGSGEERRASFASGGTWVDLAAPGTGIVSTGPSGRWSVADGTSYAAPVVTGGAALVLARSPGLAPSRVRARLAGTAEALDDRTVGAGLVDLSGAVRFTVAGSPPCPSAPALVLDAYGGLHPVGGAPGARTGVYWPDWDIARDLATAAGQRGGYVLDGFGALHPFGGAPAVSSPAYRPGWDVARAADRRPDGSVVVLDEQGGLHLAGGGPAIGAGGPWWPGNDIARDVVVDPRDPTRAYVLDAYGGVHVAGAGVPGPRISVSHRTPGRDLARRLVVLPGGRGYVLDEGGRLHPWALEGQPMPAAVAAATATGSGRGVAAAANGGLLTVSAAGALVPAGDSPCTTPARWPGRDLARAVAPAL